MAIYTVQAPDGKTLEIEGPEGASQEEVIAQAQALYRPDEATVDPSPEPSIPEPDIAKPSFLLADDAAGQIVGSGQIVGNVNAFLGGVGKQIMFDAPEFISSGFGFFPNPVSRIFQTEADRFDRAIDTLGLPREAVKLGETVGTGFASGPILGVVGSAAKVTGALKALEKGGKIKRVSAKILEQARKDPLAIGVLEGVISGAGEIADESVTAATGSKTLGVVAGLVSSGGASLKLYDAFDRGLNIAKNNRIEETLANNLRAKYTPEQIAEGVNDINFMVKEGMQANLAIAMKDGQLGNIIEQMRGNPQLAKVVADGIDKSADVFTNMVDSITSKRMGGEDIAQVIEGAKEQIAGHMDGYIALLEKNLGSMTSKKASEAMFKTFDQFFDNAKKAIDEAYLKVDLDQQIVNQDARDILLDAAEKAVATKAVKKSAVVTKFERLYSDAIKDELADEGGMTIGGLKDLRSKIFDKIAVLESAGNKVEAGNLKKMASAITESFDLHGGEELIQANSLYKSISEVKNFSSLYGFFAKNVRGVDRIAPEQFGPRFVFGTSAKLDGEAAMKFAGSKLGRRFGLTQDGLRSAALDSLNAKLKSIGKGGVVTEKQVKSFVSDNADAIETYGLSSQFQNHKEVAGRIARLDVAKETLAKFAAMDAGLTGTPDALKAMVKSGRFFKQIQRLPKEHRPAVKATAVHSLVYDNAGDLRPSKEILKSLEAYGTKAGMTNEHKRNISRILNLTKSPSDNIRITDFDTFFKDVDVGDRLQSTAVERITRPALKVIRSLKLGVDVVRRNRGRERLRQAMLTEEGAKRVLAIAAREPDSRGFVRWVMGRGIEVAGQFSDE